MFRRSLPLGNSCRNGLRDQHATTSTQRFRARHASESVGTRTGDVGAAGCVSLIVLCVAWVILERVGLALWKALATAGALCVGVVAYWRMRRNMRRWSETAIAYRRHIEESVADEVTYKFFDAICVEEDEDLGSNYFLKLANAQVLS